MTNWTEYHGTDGEMVREVEFIETRTKVFPIRVDLICPECNKGTLKYKDTLFEDPIKYKHECTECGFIANLVGGICYPRIIYEDE